MKQCCNVVVIKNAVGTLSQETTGVAELYYGMIANTVWTTKQAEAFIN